MDSAPLKKVEQFSDEGPIVVANSFPKFPKYELKHCEIVSGTSMVLLSKLSF